MGKFVFVRTSEIIPDNHLPFPKGWNMNPTKWTADIRQWIQRIRKVSRHKEKSWRKISENRWIAKNHDTLLRISTFVIWMFV
ncbi:putative protein isoform X1 [Capsicum chacoense]